MMILASAAEMQNLDRAAIEQYGIVGTVLMENAGRCTFDLIESTFGSVRGKLVPVFVGPGNNGGDGLVIARYVHQNGGHARLIYLTDPDKLKGDAAVNYEVVVKFGISGSVAVDSGALEKAVATLQQDSIKYPILTIVDALLGTGLKRHLKGVFLDAVRRINTLKANLNVPVAAVDIPTGLDADTGQVQGDCINADLTATYGCAKPGLVMHGGNNQVGELHVIDIGIPPAATEQAGLRGEALGSEILQVMPDRRRSVHKGNFGHLLVLAGSAGKTGASLLTALGALRAGTGLVTLCVPHDLNPIYESSLAEAMTVPLPHSKGHLSIDDYNIISDQLQGKSAVVLGPGLGTASDTQELVIRLYREAQVPMVVDADALNMLALEPDHLANPPAVRILTPHPGEMARLTGLSTKEIQEDRLGSVSKFLETVNTSSASVYMLLKGAGTIICDADGCWAINTTGNPGMASGGMGDVLSGIIGGLLAQGYPAPTANRLGVYVHGLAADKLACAAPFGYLASEVADMVPTLWAERIK